MHKAERQTKIRKLIQKKRMRSQDELTHELSRLGSVVTQASVSRDLDEMGIVKLHGVYSLPGANGNGSQFGPIDLQCVGDNLIVAKCLSGLASAATVRIDSAGVPGVVGTIAGDDTIFIAVSNKKAQSTALKTIGEIFK
jgi:transcriptional regulator of arginine metabolism